MLVLPNVFLCLLKILDFCWFEQVKERPDVGVYVKDLSAFVVNNADDMDRIMTLGNKNSESVGQTLSSQRHLCPW